MRFPTLRSGQARHLQSGQAKNIKCKPRKGFKPCIEILITNCTIFVLMKNLWLLFSIYILILSVLPCTDVEECNIVSQTSIAISNTTEHKDHKHESEHCSPFCTCACCSTSISFSYINTFQISAKPVFNTSISYPLFNENIKSSFFGNIWQPPKIS